MKKITRKRFTRSKGNKSFFGSVARFGAAIPLCLLMLGGLSFVGFDKALAGGTSGGDATGTVDGVPLMGNWMLDNTDTGVTPLNVGLGGNAAATSGGQGGSTTVTGAPAATADIVFNGAVGGLGSSSAAGGDAGSYMWARTTMPLTVNSITAGANSAGNGGDASTVTTTTAGNGGASSGLIMNFGVQRLTLTGANTDAINLTAGFGGDGGGIFPTSVSTGGTGGVGGDVSLTAGLLSITDNTGLNADARFVAGSGGDAGNITNLPPDDVPNIAAKTGDGGAGGNMNVTLSGINFVSAGAGNSLYFTAGVAGSGKSGGNAGAAHGGLTGQASGTGGAGGALTANVTGNINVKANMELNGGNGGDGFNGASGGTATTASAIGGAGGAGGLGRMATLNSGSINVGGKLSIVAGLGGNGGNGGNGGSGTSASIVGHGGAAGNGGAGGDVELNNLGAIRVGGLLFIDAGTGTGSGVAGDSMTSEFAAGADGGDTGAVGKISINSNSIAAGHMEIATNGFEGGQGGKSAGVNFIAGNGGTNANGGAVSISVAENIIITGDVSINAYGGTGGDAGTGTGFAAGNGGAGGTGDNVLITAKNLWIGGSLDLRNNAGSDGNATPGGAAAGYGLAGKGGSAGSIRFDAMVTAAEITGTVGQTYEFKGVGLDALQQQVSFSKDYDYIYVDPSYVKIPGSGILVGTDTAIYNIGTMRVNAGAPMLDDADDGLFIGNGSPNEDGGTTYRTLHADNLAKLNVGGFDFILPEEVRAGDIMLQVNNAPLPTLTGADHTADDLQITRDTGLTIETPARIRNMHRNLGSIDLINGEVNGADTIAGRRINSGIYRWVIEEGSLAARLDGIPGFNAYSEAQAARLAFVADGLNHVITSGIYEMSRATAGDETGIRFFASGYGSKNRYDTGHQSNADIEGAGFLAGAGWAADTVDGQRLLMGAFMEGGWGSYDTHSASHGAGFDADGATSYMGGGLMGKYTFPCGLYFDMSARIGNAKMDFSSDDLGTNGYENSFDSSNAMYYGGHFGGGYEWAIDEQQSLDFNTRLLWTHLNSDDVRSNYGDQVNFDSANSLRWRTGARYNYAFDLGTGGTLKPFVGVAYEHEFDGDAKTNVDGRRTERTASLSGGTAIGELGASWQATDNFSLELAGQGNVLTRQGGSGQLSLKWEF